MKGGSWLFSSSIQFPALVLPVDTLYCLYDGTNNILVYWETLYLFQTHLEQSAFMILPNTFF